MFRLHLNSLALSLLLAAGCASSKAPDYETDDQGGSSGPDMLDLGTGSSPDLDSGAPADATLDLPDIWPSERDMQDAATDLWVMDLGETPTDLPTDMVADLPPDATLADTGGSCAGLNCSDGLACTTDSCKAGKCLNTLMSGWCKIAGKCYLDGAKDPKETCQGCAAAKNPLAWTAGTDGVACASDGLSCTADACKAGKCGHQLQPGYCVIASACYTQGAAHPTLACQGCYPGVSNTTWTTAKDGVACASDGLSCTNDVCKAGACDHTLMPGWCNISGACYQGGTGHPTLECTTCDPSLSTSSWTAAKDGTTCTADNFSCTYDQCKGGKCDHPLMGNYCRIAGVCYPANTTQPGHLCGRCDPGKSQTTWSNAPDGAICTPDAHNCTQDVCQGGTCAHPVAPNFCFINGQCYGHGDAAPGGACNFCNATKSKMAWTPITYTGCCAGQNLYYCDLGSLNHLDCSLNPNCGWSALDQYYDCGTSGGTGPVPKNCF